MAEHVCPPWVGYLLICPLRRFSQNPSKILKPYIAPGMTVLDIGCAMGFFTIDMARMAGREGRVIAVDLQQKMIDTLMKRAAKKRLADRIDARVCSSESLCLDDLSGSVDFALAMSVVHETDDAAIFFQQVYKALVTGGKLLFSEPKAHVSEEDFTSSTEIAVNAGFELGESSVVKGGRSAVLVKR